MYDNIDLLIFLNNICANKYAYWSDNTNWPIHKPLVFRFDPLSYHYASSPEHIV